MTTWFVDGLHGNDANAGTSAAAAFATLAKAASVMTAGDTVNVCATTTYTLTSSLTWPAGSAVSTISGANASGVVDGTSASIATATNGVSPFAMSGGAGGAGFNLAYLACSSTATSPGAAIAITSGFCGITANHCSFRGFSTLATGTSSSDAKSLYDCEVSGSTGIGLNINSAQLALDSCAIHSNAGGGTAVFTNQPVSVRDCEIYANGGHGFWTNGDYPGQTSLIGCTLANNAGDGYRDANATHARSLLFVNNVFYGNSGYGANTGSAPIVVLNAVNAYGANTSGARNNVPAGTGDLTLTANPFASAGNLTPNTTAGGGAVLRAAAYPGTFLDGTTSYRDVGAIQHQDAGAAQPPPTPTLSVVDKGDGTGATATISGGDSAASNAVYVSPVPGSGNAAFTLGATIAGNNPGNLSLSPGNYLAYAEATENGLDALPSNTVFFTTTAAGGTTSIRAAIYSYFATHSAITALVGSNPARVCPVHLPETFARPALLYARAVGGHEHVLTGSAGYALTRFKLECLGDTYAQCDALAEAVRQAADGAENKTIGGVTILGMTIDEEEGDQDDYYPPIDASDAGVYVIRLFYDVMYLESIPTP